MKKSIKPVVLLLVFFAALWGFGVTMNQTNEDMTTTMPGATLPTVSFLYQGVEQNELYGYVKEMDMTRVRDSILPLGQDREVSLCIQSYGAKITQAAYEIRSLDGQRLVADKKLDDLRKDGDALYADFTVQNLLEENEEYLLVLRLEADERPVYFYTRIMQTSSYSVDECMLFALQFHEYTFRDDAGQFIPTYMDPATGDATTLHYVDLSCTLRQITWADFEGEKLFEPKLSFKEINASYNVLTLRYMLKSSNVSGETEYYNVEEYYRLRNTETRMYVLNFERTMNQIFSLENSFLTENKNIQLGIRDVDVTYRSNEAGDVVAFVQEGELWCLNSGSAELARVFSFRSPSGFDPREDNNQHDIHIVRLDEAGSVDFIVYGYMNRGEHEGEVGVGVFHYDGISHTLEEDVFIPVNQSYEILKAELGQMIYENDQDILSLMLNGSVYQISLETLEIQKLVENLRGDCFAVSESGRFLVWIAGEDSERSSSMNLIDFATGKRNSIEEDEQYYVKPLAFIGEDLIYGLNEKGDWNEPMQAIRIVNAESGNVDELKTYKPVGTLIREIRIASAQIEVELVQEVAGKYYYAGMDTIMNREADELGNVHVSTTATEVKQTQVQLVIKNRAATNKFKRMTSQLLLLEENRLVELEEEPVTERYYVYAKGRVHLATDRLSEAILLANDLLGVVVDQHQQYMWKRAHKTAQSAFTRLSVNEGDENAGSLAQCLSMILKYEGKTASVSERIESGEEPLSILQELLPDARVLDLTGCGVDAMVYYISEGKPVLAMTGEKEAVLLVGYSGSNISYYDPATQRVRSISMEEADRMFSASGNTYLGYITENEIPAL